MQHMERKPSKLSSPLNESVKVKESFLHFVFRVIAVSVAAKSSAYSNEFYKVIVNFRKHLPFTIELNISLDSL